MKLNPWQPITDPLILAKFGKLSEELSECSAAVARCIIQGIFEKEPVTGKVNADWLWQEMADVEAAMFFVREYAPIPLYAQRDRVERKKLHLAEWHRMLSGEIPKQSRDF